MSSFESERRKYFLKRYGLSYFFMERALEKGKINVAQMDVYKNKKMKVYLDAFIKKYGYRKAVELETKAFFWFFAPDEGGGGAPAIDDPKTFNEKIAWLKFNGDVEKQTRLADKYLVREYVKERVGEKYLIPLYGVWDRAEDIDFDSLPESLVLKSNNSCGTNLFVHDKSKLDIAETVKTANAWLKDQIGYATIEPHYINIPPKIIAEKLESREGEVLTDYKIYCFNGSPAYIHIIADRDENGVYRSCFYDINWNRQDFDYTHHHTEDEFPRPVCLDEMTNVAAALSEGIPYVRVDLYEIDGEVKFGEMTFTPYGGYCEWYPKGTNLMLGEMIDLGESSTSGKNSDGGGGF